MIFTLYFNSRVLLLAAIITKSDYHLIKSISIMEAGQKGFSRFPACINITQIY